MLGLSPWTSLLVVMLAALVAWVCRECDLSVVAGALESRRTAPVIAFLTGTVVYVAWGSLSRSGVMHDESAYLLQAELFARLRWTAPARPVPAFFEQLYVLVDPVLASKYPPGNSLLLAPGMWLGLPGLPVVLMSAAAGGLLFALIRRLAGSLIALLTWLIWISAFPVIYFHASYMSEVATSMLVLVAWWGLLRWRGDNRSRWLVLAATAVAWCVITRPLTGLALALAAFAVASKIVVRRRAWRDLAVAMAMAGVVLSILPLWSWRTTGNPWLSPLTLYTRTYVPFDRPGFGAIAADRPSARLPHDQWVTSEAFFEEHVRHVPAALPSIAARRLAMLDRDAWYEWRGGLRLFALLGLFLLGVEGLVALGAFGLQFALYLSYAHPPQWTLYYLEQAPVAAFLTALGAAQIISWASRGAPLHPVGSRSPVTTLWRLMRRRELCPARGGAWAGASFLTLAACFALIPTIGQVRSQINGDHRYHESFQLAIGTLARTRAVVFVRYAPNHLDGLSLVRNEPDLERSRVWTVYDRGGENELLLGIDSTRTPYLFDESSWVLRPLQRLPRPTRTSGVAPAGLPLASASRR